MYIHKTSKGTYWIRLDPARAGWYGLGRDEEWLGSYSSPEWAAKEVNKHLPAQEGWSAVEEYESSYVEPADLAA